IPAATDSIRSSRGSATPGRYTWFSRSAFSRSACSAVRACSVVRNPPRASSTATAVPKDPAPITTARRPLGPGRCSWGRARSATPRTLLTPLACRQDVREALRGSLDVVEGRRLEDALQVEDALAEEVQGVGADDREAGDTCLAGARGGFAEHLALHARLVQAALAHDDRRGGAHAGVVAERVEDERRAW